LHLLPTPLFAPRGKYLKGLCVGCAAQASGNEGGRGRNLDPFVKSNGTSYLSFSSFLNMVS
jgi:hypothetical protein